LAAYLIDVLVVAVVFVTLALATAKSKPLYVASTAFGAVFYALYTFAMHLRFGRTVGKWVMGAKVVSTGGQELSVIAALLRSTPNFVISCAWVAVMLISLSQIPEEMYLAPRSGAFWQFEAELRPSWHESLHLVLSLLLFLDSALALANRKKQTFHDYCSGTVAIRAQQRKRERS
jgi:uncharacterized RDD family membrane protein YckC